MKHWRESTLWDCNAIAANMRNEDILEVKALGHDPLGALILGYGESSVCYTLVDPDGEPVAMLGVVPIDGEGYQQVGSVWLLGTPGIEKFGYRFLKYSREVLSLLYQQSGKEVLWNCTHKDNHVHHKWLKWLGFKFIRRLNFGDSGFIEFARLKDN